MGQKLASRVGRIINASIKALFDDVDDSSPEAVMAKAIAEVDAAISDVRLELGRVVVSRHLANKRLMDEQRKYENLIDKVSLAIGQGRDDLAEVAIAQQLDLEAQMPTLNDVITEISIQVNDLEAYVAALQAKKRDMKTEFQAFQSVQTQVAQTQGSGGVLADNGCLASRVNRASLEFDTATGVPATPFVDSDEQSLAIKLAELEELARKKKIQEHLASIKGKS